MGGYSRGMPGGFENPFNDPPRVVGKSKWLSYEFDVYPPDGAWVQLPGVYIFCRGEGLLWNPLYVGETNSLRTRLTPSHEKWGPARWMGMTDVHALVVLDGTDRLRVEKELIQALQPPLNKADRKTLAYSLLTSPYRPIL